LIIATKKALPRRKAEAGDVYIAARFSEAAVWGYGSTGSEHIGVEASPEYAY